MLAGARLPRADIAEAAAAARAGAGGSGSTPSSCPRGATGRCCAWSRSRSTIPTPDGAPLIYLIDALAGRRRRARWPSCSPTRDRGRAARRPPGRGDPAPRVADRAQQHLRHPDRRRLRRRQRPGRLRQPARLDARPAGRQDRQLHALGRPAADRRAAQLRGRGRRPSARARRRDPAPPAAQRAGWSGRARSAGGSSRPPTSATPRPPGSDCRASVSSTRGPGPSRASWPRGASAPPPSRTVRWARSSPTRRWSSSPSAAPSSLAGLEQIRGIHPPDDQAPRRGDPRRDRRAACEAPPIPRDEARARSEPGDAPLIALAEALLRARALEAGLAYELIASRAELELIVGAARRGEPEPDVRTLTGWRRELVGDDLRDLLAGRRAVAVGPDRRLRAHEEPALQHERHRRGAVEHRARQSACVIPAARWIQPRSTPCRSRVAVA